jgi:PAS domain S-box-containing protein
MTQLVEHLFSVPVAYVELFGLDFATSVRVGSGQKYWRRPTSCPPADSEAGYGFTADQPGKLRGQFISEELGFTAFVPLRANDGLELGLLVIADTQPRPKFSDKDHEKLGELAGMLAGGMELRLIAGHVRELALRVEEAESRFRSIADAAPVMILYSGVDGGNSFVNKAWLEFTGRRLADELGDGYADSFHPEHRERVLDSYWQAFQKRQPLKLEFPMRRHDGEYRWVQAGGVPRFLEDGTYSGYICYLVDLGKDYYC